MAGEESTPDGDGAKLPKLHVKVPRPWEDEQPQRRPDGTIDYFPDASRWIEEQKRRRPVSEENEVLTPENQETEDTVVKPVEEDGEAGSAEPAPVPEAPSPAPAKRPPAKPQAAAKRPAQKQPAEKKPADMRPAPRKAEVTAVSAPEAVQQPVEPLAQTAVSPTRVDAPFLQQAEEPRAGVPARYDDGVAWLRAGFRQMRWGSVIGVVLGWTGAWLTLWGAVGGMVIGIFVGFGIFTSPDISGHLFSLGLGQSVTLVSVIMGGVIGIGFGFLAAIKFIFLDHPVEAVGAFLSGAVISALIVVSTACFERASIRLRGYRRLSNDEVRHVAPLVKDVAEAMNLPALPRFAIDDNVIPNAWSHMRTIVISKGLLQSLDDGEIRAILAHELTHWQSGDSVALHFVWAASLPAVLLYKFGTYLAGGIKALGVETGKAARTILGIVGWIIAWPSWILIRLVLIPVISHSSRQSEYQADAGAAAIGLAPELISALRKMSAFEGARTGWEAALAATHPPTELRIEALQAPRPDDWEYQEDELHGPDWPEVRRVFGGLRGVAKPQA